MKIANRRVLKFFNFHVIETWPANAKVSIEQPISLWLRCLWWKWTR